MFSESEEINIERFSYTGTDHREKPRAGIKPGVAVGLTIAVIVAVVLIGIFAYLRRKQKKAQARLEIKEEVFSYKSTDIPEVALLD